MNAGLRREQLDATGAAERRMFNWQESALFYNALPGILDDVVVVSTVLLCMLGRASNAAGTLLAAVCQAP